MSYASPHAFRAAVEARLRDRARSLDAAAYVLRRQAALERLVARLGRVAPGRWALKGGMALETRLGDRARVSVDLDADHVEGASAARADLQLAAAEVQDEMGYALRDAQFGGQRLNAKVLRGFGSAGVLEVAEDFDRSTYRAVYTVSFADAIYVLHAFQKEVEARDQHTQAGR